MADDENAGSRAAGLESSSSVSSQGQSSNSLQGLEPLSPEMGVVKSTSDFEPNVPGKKCGRSESTSNSQPANLEQESTAPPEQELDDSPQLAAQLRPLLLKNSHPAAVTDVQDFDFWTKPGRRGEQASESQPISSPKLWPGIHNSRAPQEGAVTSPLADRGAFSVRDSYALPEGTLESVSSLGDSEVGEFGEDGLSAMALQERGNEKDREDPDAGNTGQEEMVQSSQGKDSGQVIIQKELPPVLEKEENAEGRCREISECGADRAESSLSAFATNPASSSSSTFDSGFSIKGGPSTGKGVGLELAVVPEGRGLVRNESEGHLSDSASVSSSTATLSRKHRYGEMNTVVSKSLDSSLKAVSGRVSEEIASTSGRGDDLKAGQNEERVSPRPLYTDTPAMANDVVFGISTFGKLGRSRSFATGSIKGATVFAADEKGSGHRRAHSDVKKVSFHLENAAEGKMGGASSPRSPQHAIQLRTQVEVGHDSCRGKEKEKIAGPGNAAENQGKQKADQPSVAGSKKTENAAANGLKSSEVREEGVHKGARGEGEIVKEGAERGGSSEGSPKGESSGQLAVAEGGSPKVIDRSALFKRWMEKNKEQAGLPEERKGLAPTPILQRIGSSNDVLPPTSARRREDPFLKRTTSQSAISPPGYRLSGEIQSLEGGFESPLPSPRRKSLSMPSSPAGSTPGKHMRQLSIGASKPPKAPRSPPASPLPPKSPSSKPRDASRSPREKAVSNLSLGPAVLDASVDLGPSTSSPGGSPQTPKGASRNLGRLPPARIPSPKTNSVLRKAMSQSKADTSIHVGAELVKAGLPSDPKDAIPQLIARIIRATSKNHPLLLAPPPLKQAVQPTAPKLSQVAPLPQKQGPSSKGTSSSEPETASTPSPSAVTQRSPPPLDTSPEGLGRPPSDGVSSAPEDSSYFAASLMSLSPRALLRSASLPSYLQSVLPTSLLNTFSAQVSLTAPEPRQLTDAPPESPKPSLNPEETILLLGRLALAGEFEQEHGRALLAQAKGAVVSTLLEVLQGGSQMDREAAVGLTRVLTLLEEGRNALLDSDSLKLLVDLLWSGTPRAKVAAAGTLRNLAYKSTDQKCAIMAAGAIGPLVSLLRSTTPGAPEAAASALRSLAMADGMEEIIVQNGAIQPLVHLLHSPQSPAAKEASAATLQNLATHDEHRGVIVQSGAIPALFKMLLAPEISSQMAAAGALRNLAAGGPEYQKAIGESGAVGPLIKILGKRGPNVPPGMPEAAAGALANLALHEDNKLLLSREGGIPALTELVKSGTPPAQLVGMEALKNLATHAENCELIVKAGAVPWLVRNLGSSDRRLQRSAVRTLFTVGGQAENLKAVSEQGTLQVLEKIVNGQTGLERDDFVVKLLFKLKSM